MFNIKAKFQSIIENVSEKALINWRVYRQHINEMNNDYRIKAEKGAEVLVKGNCFYILKTTRFFFCNAQVACISTKPLQDFFLSLCGKQENMYEEYGGEWQRIETQHSEEQRKKHNKAISEVSQMINIHHQT